MPRPADFGWSYRHDAPVHVSQEQEQDYLRAEQQQPAAQLRAMTHSQLEATTHCYVYGLMIQKQNHLFICSVTLQAEVGQHEK